MDELVAWAVFWTQVAAVPPPPPVPSPADERVARVAVGLLAHDEFVTRERASRYLRQLPAGAWVAAQRLDPEPEAAWRVEAEFARRVGWVVKRAPAHAVRRVSLAIRDETLGGDVWAVPVRRAAYLDFHLRQADFAARAGAADGWVMNPWLGVWEWPLVRPSAIERAAQDAVVRDLIRRGVSPRGVVRFLAAEADRQPPEPFPGSEPDEACGGP